MSLQQASDPSAAAVLSRNYLLIEDILYKGGGLLNSVRIIKLDLIK